MRAGLPLAFVPVVALAQGAELRGRVLAADSTAIAGATVTLSAIGYSVRTDSLGAFRLTGSGGSRLALTITAGGFRADTASVLLERGRLVRRDFVLLSNDDPLPEANPSDRVLRGRVTDTEGIPLSYANIQVNGGRRFVADDTGRFTVPITVAGAFTLLIRRIGFAPEEVKLAGMPDTALAVRLRQVAMALPETRVTGTAAFRSLDLHGFYRRMADAEKGINRGYFITPEEYQVRNPIFVTSAVEHLPNIRIRPAKLVVGDSAIWPLNRNLRIEDARGCPLTVYLDRVRVSPVRYQGQVYDELINTLIAPSTVAGIEVYPRSHSAPPEFHVETDTCGLVVFWTR